MPVPITDVPPTFRSRLRTHRRLLLDVVLLVCGVVGLVGLGIAFHRLNSPAWRGVLLLAVGYQLFWWSVRVVLMIGIWRRETALNVGRKLWLGVTTPMPVLVGVWLGRGKLSGWLEAGDEETGDE